MLEISKNVSFELMCDVLMLASTSCASQFKKTVTACEQMFGVSDSRMCDRDLVPVPLGSSPPTTKMRVRWCKQVAEVEDDARRRMLAGTQIR